MVGYCTSVISCFSLSYQAWPGLTGSTTGRWRSFAPQKNAEYSALLLHDEIGGRQEVEPQTTLQPRLAARGASTSASHFFHHARTMLAGMYV